MRRHPVKFLMAFLLLAVVGSYAVWIGMIGRTLPFETLAKGDNFGEKVPKLVVVGSSEEVESLIPASVSDIKNAIRTADYQQFLVLLVFQGYEGPYASVEVQRVTTLGNQVTVQAQFTSPLWRGGPTVVNSPYHFVAVRKDGLHGPNIHFKLTNGWYVVAETTHAVP